MRSALELCWVLLLETCKVYLVCLHLHSSYVIRGSQLGTWGMGNAPIGADDSAGTSTGTTFNKGDSVRKKDCTTVDYCTFRR
jgi:hypothetical protein